MILSTNQPTKLKSAAYFRCKEVCLYFHIFIGVCNCEYCLHVCVSLQIKEQKTENDELKEKVCVCVCVRVCMRACVYVCMPIPANDFTLLYTVNVDGLHARCEA